MKPQQKKGRRAGYGGTKMATVGRTRSLADSQNLNYHKRKGCSIHCHRRVLSTEKHRKEHFCRNRMWTYEEHMTFTFFPSFHVFIISFFLCSCFFFVPFFFARQGLEGIRKKSYLLAGKLSKCVKVAGLLDPRRPATEPTRSACAHGATLIVYESSFLRTTRLLEKEDESRNRVWAAKLVQARNHRKHGHRCLMLFIEIEINMKIRKV